MEDDVMSLLNGKHGEDFDLSFISAMISHHQDAIDMSRLAREKAMHEEIRSIAEEIILEQETEILQMKDLRQSWGYPRDMGEEFKKRGAAGSREEAEA